MLTKFTLLLTLVTYSMIVSQSFMYVFALKDVQVALDAQLYASFRLLINASMNRNFKYAVYGGLLSNLLLVALTIRHPGTLLFITCAIAFVALLADTMFTIKGNLPINKVMNRWSPDQYPDNWMEYRKKWLEVFRYRQIANIAGFMSLLIGLVFGSTV